MTEKTRFTGKKKAIIAAAAGGCAVWLALFGIGQGRKEKELCPEEADSRNESSVSSESAGPVAEEKGIATPETTTMSETTPVSKATEPSQRNEARIPKSDFFEQIVQNIWGKECGAVSGEEYAELTSIQISRAEKSVSFQLNHGVVQTMMYGEDSMSSGDTVTSRVQTMMYGEDCEMALSDLASFPGLEWISVDGKLEPGDLDGLENLFAVYAQNTLEELALCLPYPEKITELGVGEDGHKKDLEGIGAFPNLQYFSVENPDLEDISALSAYPDLEGLMIERGDALQDYSPLEHLTKLKWLKLDSGQLENADFLVRMPELTSLRIAGSKMTNLDPLRACGKLTFLALENNPEMTDYSVVGQLYNLEELVLETAHGVGLPSFEQLSSLGRLSLKGADDLSPLREATGVVLLSLEDCPNPDSEAIAAMEELEVLQVKGRAPGEDVLRLPGDMFGVTELALEGITVEERAEELFRIPTLHSLTLDDCRIHLDPESLSANESLEVLSMNRITLYCPSDDGGEIKMTEYDKIFDCLPNLRELYAESLRLEDIAFVEKLPHLQHLDIRDNPVESLKPLRNLKEIKTVWYQNGTILFP